MRGRGVNHTTKLNLLREAKRRFSNLRSSRELPEKAKISTGSDREMSDGSTSYWGPHPRTGIYVPRGREWVVDDVPKDSGSLNQTYWLRNVDGVDQPDPDVPTDHYFRQPVSDQDG